MNKQALLLLTLGLAIGSHISAFAQAAAESALINGLSSSATVKAGTALNHSLNRSSSQLGARIQERTSGPTHLGVQQKATSGKNTAMVVHSRGSAQPGSTQGFGTISILGGQVTCTPLEPGSQVSEGKTVPQVGSTNCHNQGATTKARPEDMYKSSVVLPTSK
jgi:hypothetical protein